ncbi:MAG TPA: DNA polymerase III subunit delta [Candidatus Angelobacter sp.]|nr:DNA polymerase III subunit delta [Candidatus Angelobacter sp.]
MKISGRNIESFLRGADETVAAVLFYGPDAGLVRERAERLTAAVAGDAADPFRISELTAERLRDQPSLLSDEAAALSFGGGRRVVRLRSAGDGQSSAVESFLKAPAGGGLVIVEADELGPRSSLRQLFEAAANAAALPCYRDETGDLARVIGEELGRAGLRLTDEARDYLAGALGGDRGVTRRELEKIVSYMGPAESARALELADALACVGDSAALSVDDLVFALGDGDLAAVERLADRVLAEGATPVAILRMAGRHFLRLHLVASAEDRERAIRSLKPPVFYKLAPRLHEQVRQWTPVRLHQAADRLMRAEMDCKRTGMPAEVLCRRVLLEIAAQAPRRTRGG